MQNKERILNDKILPKKEQKRQTTKVAQSMEKVPKMVLILM